MSVWNSSFEADPAGTASPKLGDDRIRELKAEVRKRLAKEHVMYTLSGSGQENEDGWHNLGSAKIYFGSVAPTVRPDNATSLDSSDAGRLWYDSSTEKTYVWNGSAWKLYGATASGGVTTGVNFLNGGFETDLSNWVTYDDGANAKPVDGTGGSPTAITVSRSLVSPMFGTASMVIAKSAADAQGEGVANQFTIDAGATGTEFDCFVYLSTDTNYVASDMGIYLYDVTNAVIVPMTVETIPVTAVTSKFRCRGIYTNSLSYRLCFHVKTTSALSYNVKIDQISFDTNLSVYGAAIGPWTPYPAGVYSGLPQPVTITEGKIPIGAVTTNPSKASSVITDIAKSRVVGENLELFLQYRHEVSTGANNGSGDYVIGLPIGYSFASQILLNTTASVKTTLGGGGMHNTASNGVPVTIDPYNANCFRLARFQGTVDSWQFIGSGLNGLASSAIIEYSISVSIPVSQLVGKCITQLAESAGPLYLSNTTATDANDSTDSNTYTGIDGSTVPSVTTSAKTKRIVHRALLPNEVMILEFYHASTKRWIASTDLAWSPAAGLYASVGVDSDSPSTAANDCGAGLLPIDDTHTDIVFLANASRVNSVNYSWATFGAIYTKYRVRVGPQNAVELPPTQIASYSKTTGQVMSAGVTKMLAGTSPTIELNSIGSNFDTSTGVFTCTHNGGLRISMSSENVTGGACEFAVYKNGTKDNTKKVSIDTNRAVAFSLLNKCVVGDTFDVRVNNSGNIQNTSLQFEVIRNVS